MSEHCEPTDRDSSGDQEQYPLSDAWHEKLSFTFSIRHSERLAEAQTRFW